MILARSCWYSGDKDWMAGTVLAQTLRKDKNAAGQFSTERSMGGWAAGAPGAPDLLLRGNGTEGGLVVQRSAAKYKQRAGPEIMRSPSALLSSSGSRSLSTLA
jgi:hypothetical protein